MRTTRPPTLGQVIGRNLRAIRKELNWRQDDLARHLRAIVGFHWTRSTITHIESGQRSLDVAEFAGIVVTLGLFDVSATQLLRGSGFVELGDVGVGLSELRRALAGDPFRIERRHYAVAVEDADEAELASRGDTEQKVAARLGADPLTVSKLAFERWGRSLTDERDARVGDLAPKRATSQTLRALRGHETRKLQDIIDHVIKEMMSRR
jgi:transcriptional regulator with XRE-family HTH domain